MKCLVLTNPKHEEFLAREIAKYHSDENGFALFRGEVNRFPVDYDIGISFMHLHKVPALQVNTHKWYNFHPAPLPEYKGRNLCYHAIMNGEKEFGASLHYMDENFDTGAIIDVWHFPIHDWMTAGDVNRDAIETSKAMFEEYFPQILAGEHFEIIQNVGGTYYEKMPIDDVVHISENSKRWIRAIYAGDYRPKIEIGGVTYKIVKDE